MKITRVIVVLMGFVSLGVQTALADTVSVPTTFATLASGDSDGDNTTYTVVGDLTIQSGGSITCNDPAIPSGASACDIKIVVTGNMIMDAGSAILAENNVASGNGGNITISVGGNLVMHGGIPGAKISSSDTTGGGTTGNAGNITITVGTSAVPPPTGDFTMEPGAQILADSVNRSAGDIIITVARSADVDGLVESFGGISGIGVNQPRGGGPITIDAGCDLTVSDTGKISSRGQDPGADLVHLQGGCVVDVFGLVESTGVGHVVPKIPPNHCAVAGKPANSTACVEIWAGDSLTIDAKNQNGQVNADTGGPGGSSGTSWIDLFARGPISIIGDNVVPFAVHANGKAGTNDNGGIITVKSRDANVLASGLALQADAINPGGSGGSILVQAKGPISLDTASIFARGDFVSSGGFGKGGAVEIRAFDGNLSWQNGFGDVRPTGANPSLPLASRGTIIFDHCTTGSEDTTGTLFPANGPTPPPPDTANVGACGGSPVIPATLPPCLCVPIGVEACIGVTKFCTDANELGQPIHFNGTVRNCGTDALNAVNVVDDNGTPANAADDVKVLGPISLAVGGSQAYSGSYTPGASGPSTDTVTATGTGAVSGTPVTDHDSATCSVPAAGGEGCTPGYWKQSQHFGSWPPLFTTTELVNQVFNVGACTVVGNKTLLQALSLAGGKYFCDKVALLIHAATASVLNAASGIGFPLSVNDVVTQVNAAIATGDPDKVIDLQGALDDDNNLGCPLN